MDRLVLKGLTADDFVSDTDKWALDNLKKLPLLPLMVQKFYEVGLDRWMYCHNMSMSVRCGPNQYQTLYGIMRESAAVLDMPEPELYVTFNPIPNAFAGGVERPFITLRSGLIEALTDEQIYHLIGHELGHIKAGHVLYFSLATLLFPLLDMLGRSLFGLGDVAGIAIVLAFYEWARQAEISADRAALLVTQDLGISLDANLMMASGLRRFDHEMSREAFLDQARAYQDFGGLDAIGKVVMFLLQTATYTHPMPVHRAQQLDRWVESGEFKKVLDRLGSPVTA